MIFCNFSKEYLCHLNKDIDAWSKRITSADTTKSLVESKIKSSLSGKSHATKFSRTNKVVNFLYSIGFELVGDWLRFNDIGFNRRVIELMLKLFTSFAQDRDMTLYKELNINVMGQRSAVTRERYSFIRANSGLTNQSEEKATDHFQVNLPLLDFNFNFKIIHFSNLELNWKTMELYN